jgi:hypothetical protein
MTLFAQASIFSGKDDRIRLFVSERNSFDDYSTKQSKEHRLFSMEIAPEDRIRKEVLGARIDLYMAARSGSWRPRWRATW